MSELGSNNGAGTVAPAELATARGALYGFLSGAFAEPPSEHLLADLRDPEFAELLGQMFDRTFAEELQASVAAETDAAATLRQAFMDLFKVPGGRYVQPYESVYRDTREINGRQVGGLLMGPSAAAVQKWYRLAALEISPEFKDLPDHIALELHYLAHLCEREAEFGRAGDDAKATRAREMERDFLKAHIVTWMPDLAAKIAERSDNRYYRVLARLAVEYSQRDLENLETALGPSTGAEAPAYTD